MAAESATSVSAVKKFRRWYVDETGVLGMYAVLGSFYSSTAVSVGLRQPDRRQICLTFLRRIAASNVVRSGFATMGSMLNSVFGDLSTAVLSRFVAGTCNRGR